MNEFLYQPGFLGTRASRAEDLTLLMMLAIAALFSLGVVLAIKHRYQAHRWVQTSAATLNALLALWMMVPVFSTIILRRQGGVHPGYFYLVTSIHALVGLTAIIFGLFVVLRANGLAPKALRFKNYKPYMRSAYALYMLATALGVAIYFIWHG